MPSLFILQKSSSTLVRLDNCRSLISFEEKTAGPYRSENHLDGSDQKNKQPLQPRTNPRHVKNLSTATRSRTPSAQRPREMVTKACELSGRRQPILDFQAHDLSDIKSKTMNHFLSPPKSLSEISDFSHTQVFFYSRMLFDLIPF